MPIDTPRLPSKLTRRKALTLGAAGATSALISIGGAPLSALAKAPMLGPSLASHHRFTLGDFEITTFLDGTLKISGLFPAFGAEQFQEDVDEVAKANFLPTGGFEMSYAPVLVNTGKELILFDTGNGATKRPDRGKLARALKGAGYTPEQVDIVVITHYHPDHIGGLNEGGKPIFPNARYIAGATEHNFWSPKQLAESGGSLASRAKLVQSHVVPLADKITFFKDGQDVVSGIRALASDGHTPGHLAYHLESKGRRLLLWGDAIVHQIFSFQKPDWKFTGDMDHEKAAATRVKLLGMAAADRIPVTGYHLPFPSVGYVEALGEGFRFVPASYQFRM